jgi:hypothetical protein
MAYTISLSNGDAVDLSNLAEVKRWIKGNAYVLEDNADLWGIDETITSQGQVCLYETGNDGDMADGTITRPE